MTIGEFKDKIAREFLTHKDKKVKFNTSDKQAIWESFKIPV